MLLLARLVHTNWPIGTCTLQVKCMVQRYGTYAHASAVFFFFWSRAPSFLVSKSWAIRQTVSDCLYTASTDVLRWKPLDIGRDLLLQEIQIELFLYAPRASPKSVHFFNSSEPNKCQHASDSPPSCSCHAESCERPFSTWVWPFFETWVLSY